jgi:hypothetical protein
MSELPRIGIFAHKECLCLFSSCLDVPGEVLTNTSVYPYSANTSTNHRTAFSHDTGSLPSSLVVTDIELVRHCAAAQHSE